MAMTFRRKATAGGLIASAVLIGAFAFTVTGASAGDSPTPPSVSSEGGATDLNGNQVESRTYVGDSLPDDLGTLECSAMVSSDGTVTVQQGACGHLTPAPH